MYPQAAALPGDLLHVKYSDEGLRKLITKLFRLKDAARIEPQGARNYLRSLSS